MKCDTYLINDGKCACGLLILDIRKNNERIRLKDDGYQIKNPLYNRPLTKKEKDCIEYRKRLSNLNGMPGK